MKRIGCLISLVVVACVCAACGTTSQNTTSPSSWKSMEVVGQSRVSEPKHQERSTQSAVSVVPPSAPQPAAKQPAPSQPVIHAGYVLQYFGNPLEIAQNCDLNWGSAPVNIIPDSRTGGEMFSRQAFFKFKVGPAHSSNRWWEYEPVWLPRSSQFMAGCRAINAWGEGPTAWYPFSTGSHSEAVQGIILNVPGRSEISASASPDILSNTRPVAPFGNGQQLRLEYEFDSRRIGAFIKWLLFGR